MPDGTVDQSAQDPVDAAMDSWRQGDCVLGRIEFGLLAAMEGDDRQDADWGTIEVEGLVVVTQSCDILRARKVRPYIEVSPLVRMPAEKYAQIEACQMPQFAAIPGVRQQGLVADLDLGMTVEKGVVAAWRRTEGLRSDEERRRFGRALARKRARFAFPDDFNPFVQPLQRRLRSRSSGNTPESEAIRALAEIRVLATPDWSAPTVELTFFFVMKDEAPMKFGLRSIHEFVQEWLGRLTSTSKYHSIAGQATYYVNMTAADYVQADQLDLDNVSRE